MRPAPPLHAVAVLSLAVVLCPLPARAAPHDAIGAGLARALAPLDSRAATGVLYDRVLPLSGIERFDGRTGAPPADLATWRQLYFELERASLTPTGWPGLAALARGARESSRAGVIPLAVVDERYDRLRPDALSSGAVVARAGRLEPGSGEALRQERAFAATALVDHTYRGAEVRFALDRARWFGNQPLPTRLELDAADGQGWRPLPFDRPAIARYASPGTRTVRVRATAPDGSVREAAFPFAVEAVQAPSPDDTLHITATVPYLGQYGTGDAYVSLATGHSALVNPVIVVEGFDLDNSMNWDELYALLEQQGLLDQLHADGFDAVVLNFTDATDYVEKNAFVVMQTIQEVESLIDPQATIAVAGASMGGLCSRYALAYLESHAIPHRVRTWISFDGPQAGADVPLGLQYWVSFFSGQSADAAAFLDVLNRPAAREMLIYHLTDPPGSTGQHDPGRDSLLANLASVGEYPSLPRRVAIANGSGTGQDQGFAAGDQIILYEYSSLAVDVTGDVWAVPDQVSGTIFQGDLRILFSDTPETVTVSGTGPWDGAPGGWRASMAELDSVTAPYGDIIALHPSHDFVPTISSLALATTDPFYDVSGDPDLLAHTPFDAVYYPTLNQEHVQITPENAVWFRDEIEQGVVATPPAGRPAIALSLSPGAPNPFASSTRLSFALPADETVRLRVYSVDGRLVRTLASGRLTAGRHDAAWDGTDRGGRPVAPGLYLARLDAGGRSVTTRLVRLD